VNDTDEVQKVNIDSLYDNKQKRDLKQVSIFNKILNRINTRITVTGRTKKNDKHVWFTVPEYIFGEPIYDQGDCIGYLVNKLEENGFHVKYIHPNTLFVSWSNWIPSYVRSEIKKKTGKIIDEKGNIIDNEDTFGILVEGITLQIILESKSMKERFLKILGQCQAVVVCRASPS
jgi:hypothetical protein